MQIMCDLGENCTDKNMNEESVLGIQSTLDISNSDISNSAELEALI